MSGGNVDGKLSGKKMEGDDGLRTLECLRGRLLAERAASRVAKEDAEQMGNKLTELENQLREEIKSRNRVEKRLKFLMKKLESLNISYVSEDSGDSSFLEKSEMSSVSSSTASTKEIEDKETKTQITNCAKCEIEEGLESSMKKTKCPIGAEGLEEENVSEITSSNPSQSSPIEESLIYEEKPNFQEDGEVNSNRNYHHPKTDGLSSSSLSDQAGQGDYVDNSLALVPIDLPKESQPTVPIIVNASVKDVLEALRHAREQLQWSMERRHMIKVGSK